MTEEHNINSNVQGKFAFSTIDQKIMILSSLSKVVFTEEEINMMVKKENLNQDNPEHRLIARAKLLGKFVSCVYDEILI